MSLLSLPNEILIKFILSCDNITISDLFHLMVSCRRLHNIIVESNKLWMCKFLARWPEKRKEFQEEEEDIVWDWVFSLRVIEEVKKSVTVLSSQCYPLGKSVTPVLAVEKWVEDEFCPSFYFDEDELHDLVFNEEMKNDFTLSHYASIALKKLRTSVQVRNLNSFIAKSESEKTILEGAKLISKWFHFSGNELTHKLVDDVEEFEKIVKRVEQLVEEKNITALEDILKCITEVLYGKLNFRVRNYKDYNFNVLKHKAASIHWVLKGKIGYPAVICVIYLEVATRMGITCDPIFLDCIDCSNKLILRCSVEDSEDVFYINIRDGSFFDLPSIHPNLVDQPACSSEVFFGKMLEAVIANDLICPRIRNDSSKAELRSAVRLVSVFWPVKVNALKYAKLCLEANDQVEDAYRLLLSAEVDSNDPVMIDCVQKLNSQQAIMDEAKLARHRLPSITFAIGLIIASMHKDISAEMRDVLYVIISWDESFREEESRQKWGISFTPITVGYRRDQPYYHISCVMAPFPLPLGTNLYVPQECLELRQISDVLNFKPKIGSLDIFFERFDGRRFIPNAQHKAHFPEDDAFASAMIEQS